MKPRISPFLRSFVLAASLIGTLPGAAAQQNNSDVIVDSVGQASNASAALAKQLAINEAVREAIERALGAYVNVSATLRNSEDFESFEQRITKISSGVGRVVQLLNEQVSGETVTVTLRVAVSKPSLERELKQFLTRKGDPRIVVVIPEVILRRIVPDPAAQTELVRALVSAGYRVVDNDQTRALAQRELVRNGQLDAQAVRDIAGRFQADVLLTGEAFAEEAGTVLGQRGYTARLELKAVDLATGQVFFSDAYTSTGLGMTDAVAGKTALQNTAHLAAPVVPGVVLSWLSGNNRAAARVFTLRLLNAPSFSIFNATLAALRGVSGVSAVQSRQFDSASAVVEVEYDGNAEDLATQLEALRLTVSGLSAGEITAQFSR